MVSSSEHLLMADLDGGEETLLPGDVLEATMGSAQSIQDAGCIAHGIVPCICTTHANMLFAESML